MLVVSKVYQSVEDYFLKDNTEVLSLMRKGMDFHSEDLIRVLSALGEIKEKKGEWKNFRDDAEGIFANTSGGGKQLKN